MNLSEKFNQQEFINWIEKFLPDFSNDYRKVDIPKGLTGVRSISTLGESTIGVRVFIIETEKDPSGRKIGLAKESFNLIKNYGTANALIAYYSKESTKWRLSLLTSTPEWSDGKIITKLSNPKRQSYVLGPQSKVNTPTKFLLKKESVTDINELKNRFSLEVVNKEFYREISRSFTKLVGGTLGMGKNQESYDSILKLPSTVAHSQAGIEFAVRLIGRVIFCWFLREKKGSDGTSLMPKELLSLDVIKKYPDYYHKVLEPIFFEVLNKPLKSRKSEFEREPYSLIPYLNGGLFSPHEDDFYKRKNGDIQSQFHNTLVIPDSWFIELFETLETYNFTIDENTSFDEELSIDPEMLGRIFENLLAEINPETGESVRKSTGSYYTPREIVDFMVDESLLRYLCLETKIDQHKLRAVITYDMSDDAEYPLSDSEKQNVIDAIEKIKILDPACGSGAYPIGALQKMVFILQQVDPDGQLWFKKQIKNTSPEIRRVIEREFSHKNFDYIRKLGVIRENIYGVDIQTIATEISRLRCFLTLVVDERIDDSLENRGIEPLPNLDFKFVTANSLIGLPNIYGAGQTPLFDDTERIDALKEIRDQYFNAFGIEREQLKTEFVTAQKRLVDQLIKEHGFMGVARAELTQKLTDWEPFSHKSTTWFDPEWMFGVAEGFDVVIGNPPYGLLNKKQNQKLGHKVSKSDLNYYKNSELYAPAKGGMINVFRLFVCQSIALLVHSGNFSLIFPLAFMGDLSASKLREFILTQQKIDYIEAFPERDNEKKRVFEAVKMSVCILGVTKESVTENSEFPLRIHSDKYVDKSNKEAIFSPNAVKKIDPTSYTIPLVNPNELKLLVKISESSTRLSEIAKCFTGEIDLTFNKDLLTSNPEDAVLIKGAQVQRYDLLDKMSQGEIMYLDKKGYQESTNGERSSHYLIRRIVMQGITGINEDIRLKMTIVDPPIFCANSVNYLVPHSKNTNLEYLLGILNSKLLNWCFKTMSTNSNVNGYEVDNLPIVICDEKDQEHIANLVRGILSPNQQSKDLSVLEKEIDKFVCELYGLNMEEIKIIEMNKP